MNRTETPRHNDAMVRRALKFVIGAVLFAALAVVLLVGGLLDGRPLVALLGAVMVAIAIGCVVLAVRVTRSVRRAAAGPTM